MPKLTPEEKQLGKAFRSAATAQLMKRNQDDPCTYKTPSFLAIFRHKCAARGGKSTAMQLKEVYVFSADPIPVSDQLPYENAEIAYDPVDWPGGIDRFGYVYREGRCGTINSTTGAVQGGCGETGRSPVGFFVDAYDRPPLEGKVARSAT